MYGPNVCVSKTPIDLNLIDMGDPDTINALESIFESFPDRRYSNAQRDLNSSFEIKYTGGSGSSGSSRNSGRIVYRKSELIEDVNVISAMRSIFEQSSVNAIHGWFHRELEAALMRNNGKMDPEVVLFDYTRAGPCEPVDLVREGYVEDFKMREAVHKSGEKSRQRESQARKRGRGRSGEGSGSTSANDGELTDVEIREMLKKMKPAPMGGTTPARGNSSSNVNFESPPGSPFGSPKPLAGNNNNNSFGSPGSPFKSPPPKPPQFGSPSTPNNSSPKPW